MWKYISSTLGGVDVADRELESGVMQNSKLSVNVNKAIIDFFFMRFILLTVYAFASINKQLLK